MGNYAQKSQTELLTAHTDLIVIFNEVVKEFDNTILYGYRSPVLQFELYKKGRSLVNGLWEIVDISRVVTYKDGYVKMSKHNYTPSLAIDAVPYPINWKDTDRMYLFSGYVLGVASRLREEGVITHRIRWGGDWDDDKEVGDETFMDLVHFEII